MGKCHEIGKISQEFETNLDADGLQRLNTSPVGHQ